VSLDLRTKPSRIPKCRVFKTILDDGQSKKIRLCQPVVRHRRSSTVLYTLIGALISGD